MQPKKTIKKIAYVRLNDGFQTYVFWEGQFDPERYKFLTQKQLNQAIAICESNNIIVKDMTKSVTIVGSFMNIIARK